MSLRIRATYLFWFLMVVLFCLRSEHWQQVDRFFAQCAGGAAFVVLAYGIVKHFEDPQTSYFFRSKVSKMKVTF